MQFFYLMTLKNFYIFKNNIFKSIEISSIPEISSIIPKKSIINNDNYIVEKIITVSFSSTFKYYLIFIFISKFISTFK